MSRLVFLDTETTGLDPYMEQLFEIAVVEEDGTEHVFRLEPHELVVENMHPKAVEVNRYHERTSAPDWTWDDPLDVCEALNKLLGGAHIVGAVPDFDARFIRAKFAEWGMEAPRFHYHLIDIESMVVGYLAGDGIEVPLPWDSEALSRLIGVEPADDEDRHTALGDARWVRHMYLHMTEGAHLTLTRLENSKRSVLVHRKADCNGDPCTIHNPSDHSMRSFPQHWRDDRGIMERICPHGIGHPDPDDMTEDTVHGCDGCCASPGGSNG